MPSEADVIPTSLPPNMPAGFNTFVSTFVYDALDIFAQRDEPERELAARIRVGIRAFALSQQEDDGTWHFLGRGSRMDSDIDSTACAAGVVLDRSNRSSLLAAIERFCDEDGLYPTYVNGKGVRYSWILADGSVVFGHDRVVHANVARFLSRAGVKCPRVWDFLQREVLDTSLAVGSPDYPNPLTFFFMLSRAYSDDHEPCDAVANRIVRCLEAWFRVAPSLTDAPLSHTMAAIAWLRFRGAPDQLRRTLEELRSAQSNDGGWASEPFFVGGYASRALSTALAASILIRANVRASERIV
jgi:hypothetical protein